MEEQRTIGWYRARLGSITGSRVGDLMVSGRGKDAYFGQTAMSYIYQVAGERDMNEHIVENDDALWTYIEQTNVTTKAMQWGTEFEPEARDLYERIKHTKVSETGSTKHPSIPFFASSPDGNILDEDGKVIGCLEIKCPNQNTYTQYRAEIHNAEDLKKVKPLYYWQCMSHMMVTGAEWTDFVAYSPFQKHPIHIVHIPADQEAFKVIEERVTKANEVIDGIINQNTAENSPKSA